MKKIKIKENYINNNFAQYIKQANQIAKVLIMKIIKIWWINQKNLKKKINLW